MAYDDMRRALEQFGALSDATWAAIAAMVSARRVAAGDHLLRAGTRAVDAFFVRRGLLREYYVDAAGAEATRSFIPAGGLSGSLADLLRDGPAAVSIEALEPAEICRVPWARLDRLSEARPDLMRVLRGVAEALYLRKATREFEMLTMPAVDRYRRFTAANPGLAPRLPRHMIASYLGITPVHLCRIAAGTARRDTAAPPRRMRSAR